MAANPENSNIVANSTAQMPTNSSSDGQVLEAILVELKQLNFFIKQLPLYLNTGKNIIDEEADYTESLTGLDVTTNSSLA